MHETDMTTLHFCSWVPWAARSSLLQDDGPWLGVYLWARFLRAPSPSAKPYPNLPRQVIYIGEAKNIDRRPLAGVHHRLVHYRDTFPDDPNLQMLYVSVCRVRRFAAGFGSKKARGPLFAAARLHTVDRSIPLPGVHQDVPHATSTALQEGHVGARIK